MHILPDAVESVPDHVSDQFPMGYFFAALGFFLLFLLTRVVSPIISGKDRHDHGACSTAGGCCAPPVLPQVLPVSVWYRPALCCVLELHLVLLLLPAYSLHTRQLCRSTLFGQCIAANRQQDSAAALLPR